MAAIQFSEEFLSKTVFPEYFLKQLYCFNKIAAHLRGECPDAYFAIGNIYKWLHMHGRDTSDIEIGGINDARDNWQQYSGYRVLCLDRCFNHEAMEKLRNGNAQERAEFVIGIDHHDFSKGLIYCDKRPTCMITWLELFPDEPVPDVIKMAAEHDVTPSERTMIWREYFDVNRTNNNSYYEELLDNGRFKTWLDSKSKEDLQKKLNEIIRNTGKLVLVKFVPLRSEDDVNLQEENYAILSQAQIDHWNKSTGVRLGLYDQYPICDAAFVVQNNVTKTGDREKGIPDVEQTVFYTGSKIVPGKDHRMMVYSKNGNTNYGIATKAAEVLLSKKQDKVTWGGAGVDNCGIQIPGHNQEEKIFEAFEEVFVFPDEAATTFDFDPETSEMMMRTNYPVPEQVRECFFRYMSQTRDLAEMGSGPRGPVPVRPVEPKTVQNGVAQHYNRMQNWPQYEELGSFKKMIIATPEGDYVATI